MSCERLNMRKLKLVKQIDTHGCGVACIAMISGKKYFEVREVLHSNIKRLMKLPNFQNDIFSKDLETGVSTKICPCKYDVGIYSSEFENVLKKCLGLQCSFIKFHSLRTIKKHCILFLVRLSGYEHGSHAVVFDAKSRRILDPCDELKNLDDHNVACCLQVG